MPAPTPSKDHLADHLADRLSKMREKAAQVGSMSALWDLVSTGEDILAGRGHWPYESEEAALRAIFQDKLD